MFKIMYTTDTESSTEKSVLLQGLPIIALYHLSDEAPSGAKRRVKMGSTVICNLVVAAVLDLLLQMRRDCSTGSDRMLPVKAKDRTLSSRIGSNTATPHACLAIVRLIGVLPIEGRRGMPKESEKFKWILACWSKKW